MQEHVPYDGSRWLTENAPTVCSLEQLVNVLIERRGYTQAELSAADPETLYSPDLLLNSDRFADRMEDAIKRKQKILVYGDYDVDGIMGTTLFCQAIMEKFGVSGEQLHYFIPDRYVHGYGLNMNVAPDIVAQDFNLVVTIDNGSTAAAAVRFLKQHCIDTLVNDHHLISIEEEIAPAYAIVNQNQSGCPYPNKHLCGAGVAWKMVEKLCGRAHAMKWIDLLGLALVADVMELRGENRTLEKLALQKARADPHRVIWAFCNIGDRHRYADLTSENFAYDVGPGINVSHRMPRPFGAPNPAVELALGKSDRVGEVVTLDRLVDHRQYIQERVSDLLVQTIREQESKALLFLAPSERYFYDEGTAGIHAASLLQATGKPAVAFAPGRTALAPWKASCRSPGWYNMKEGLHRAKRYLKVYGGHAKAAGLSIEQQRVPEFRQFLWNDAAEHARGRTLQAEKQVDAIIEPALLMRLMNEERCQFAAALEYLGPFGEGNQGPQLLLPNAHIRDYEEITALNRHLKLETDSGPMIWYFWGFPRSRLFWDNMHLLHDILVSPSLATLSEDAPQIRSLIQSMRQSLRQLPILAQSRGQQG